MKRNFFLPILAFVLLFGLTAGSNEQSYSFMLEKEVVHVYWNSDGSMSLDYQFYFNNAPDGHAIDFVDVGMPNNIWEYSSVRAEVNGNPVKISTDYQGSGTGFAVDLGNNAIRAGERGTVHVYVGKINKVLYPNDELEEYASAVFSPTWFSGEFAFGDTDLTLSLHLPPGIQPEEPRYYYPSDNWEGERIPEIKIDESGRVTYTWHDSQAKSYRQYTFGASFPAGYVPQSAIVTPSLLERFGIDKDTLLSLGVCAVFAFFFVGVPILNGISARKRKLKYMPPKIAIEGHGIKRGLTAVEAAILMQEPLDKVLTMILFGVIKKGAASVTKRDPLRLQIANSLPENLHPYEKEFLEAFSDKRNNRAKQRKALQKVTVNLVDSVAKKMKGFSRKETIAYYKKIMERAWQQIEAADTPAIKSETYEKTLEWTMLDENYDKRTKDVFRTGPVYLPRWWGHYDPTMRKPAGSAHTASPSQTSRNAPSVPKLPGADFAASMVTGVENFSSNVIGNLNDFTSKVTDKTNPVPVSSGSRSSGGGSCACACACAGCACACAGGGR
jgi:hypothetical protein